MTCSTILKRLLCSCLVVVGVALPAQILDEPDFLPVDEAYPTEVELTEDGQVLARWVMPEGYYLYRHSLNLVGKDGTTLGDVLIPNGIPKTDEFFGDVEVYYNFLEISAPVLSQTTADVAFDVHFQGCADAGLCYPPEAQAFRLTKSGSGFGTGGVSSLSLDGPGLASSVESSSTPGGLSIWVALGSALLAGMILNLMPCVFPILSIKALAMLQGASEANQVSHSLAYLGGVVGTFLALALLLLALRAFGAAIGWGFQLQSPGFVAAMALLFFLMSANMLGAIEIPGFGVSMSQPNPFLTGVLAVIVATPCTVPFMAAAIGYAITQGGLGLVFVMTAMGAGMAIPYVVITATPQLARILPRPGAWMVTLKRIMAVPLILTVVWLVWVLTRQVGGAGVAWSIGAMIVLSLAVFIGRRQVKWLASVWALMLLVIAGTAYAVSVPISSRNATQLSEFEYEAFQKALDVRKPLFVNVTADWCLTCLANERTTLSRTSVREALSDHGVEYLKVDWTNRDAEITKLLESHGRYGVPTYVLYPQQAEPVLLPQVLTPALVNEYLVDYVSSGDTFSIGPQTNAGR
ncbi:MAG: protein-disulfide reductase DsbD [Gammaproteobacteria bacterium]|nr:protein-disulfide reductase DsbD [Gammaproteobacteria bacterium]